MSRRVEVRDRSYAVRPSSANLHATEARAGDRDIDGAVRTPDGIVQCGSWSFTTNAGMQHGTHLQFVWKRRVHWRFIKGQAFTKRGLVTLAVRFARDIVAGRVKP